MAAHISEQAKRRNEFFDDLLESLTTELLNLGVDEQSASTSAENIAFKLHENWQGISIVFTKKPRLVMERLRQQALSEFNGRDTAAIIRKYGISENTFYGWLREERKKVEKELDEQQGQLDL